MQQISLAAARVVDPVLTTIAQGFKQAGMVAPALFPRVNVPLRAGKIITFGREEFILYDAARAPGENTKRISIGRAAGDYALIDSSLEGKVAIEYAEESENSVGIDEFARSIAVVQSSMELSLEKKSADLARTAGNYGSGNKITLSGTARWSDYTGVSQPVRVIETAKEAVRAATGKRANTVVMGAKVFAALKNHPVIIDRIKYTGRDVATAELLASLFGVDRVFVGDAIYSNDDGTAFIDVWGNDVVVAYTKIGDIANKGEPSYGYTYNLKGYPLVEEPYYDKSAKSWLFPVSRAENPVIASAAAGYLIISAVD